MRKEQPILDFEKLTPGAWIAGPIVAKYIRRDLKKVFPTTKFSVRYKSYAGGSSIDVRWTDGPTSAAVNKVAGKYESKGFDGMIDLAYSYSFYLLPNGELECAGTSGTQGSMGTVPSFENVPTYFSAKKVSLEGGYVMCERTQSNYEADVEAIAARFQASYSDFPKSANWRNERFGNQWGSEAVNKVLSRVDYTNPELLPGTINLDQAYYTYA